MHGIMIAALILSPTIVFLHAWPDLDGTYVNDEQDFKVVIHGMSYDSEQGRPLILDREQRHVEFEDGAVTYLRQKFELQSLGVFYSPNRMSRYDLTGHPIAPGYMRIYKTEREQELFIKALQWRAIWGGPTHRAEVSRVNGEIALVVDGIPLTKVLPVADSSR